MTLATDVPELLDALARLAPYARHTVEAAADHAHRIHADEVGLAHLLSALMDDADCGAHRFALHYFADPETISMEGLALADGILVVGSGQSLPFSVLGVVALEAARRSAAERRAPEVGPGALLAAAVGQLSEAARAKLGLTTANADALAEVEATAEGAGARLEGPLFQDFSMGAKRVCGIACRTAAQLQRRAIAPAHLVLAAVEEDAGVREASGLRPFDARSALKGLDEDLTPLEERRLRADEELVQFLGGVEAGTDTLGLFGRLLETTNEELRLCLNRHRLRPEAARDGRGAFRDPDPPGHELGPL